MMREMEIFDVMTANRDARVWAVARGSDLKVVRQQSSQRARSQNEHSWALPDGKHVYLGAKKRLAK